MGVAAYQRGSQVIRDQIDREQAEKPKPHPAEIALFHAERINGNLRAKVESLESQLEKARQYLRLARLERDALRDQAVRDGKRIKSLMEHGERMKRSWLKASKLLRLIPSSIVNDARSTGEHRT